jgi:hypothetical protein
VLCKHFCLTPPSSCCTPNIEIRSCHTFFDDLCALTRGPVFYIWEHSRDVTIRELSCTRHSVERQIENYWLIAVLLDGEIVDRRPRLRLGIIPSGSASEFTQNSMFCPANRMRKWINGRSICWARDNSLPDLRQN